MNFFVGKDNFDGPSNVLKRKVNHQLLMLVRDVLLNCIDIYLSMSDLTVFFRYCNVASDNHFMMMKFRKDIL